MIYPEDPHMDKIENDLKKIKKNIGLDKLIDHLKKAVESIRKHKYDAYSIKHTLSAFANLSIKSSNTKEFINFKNSNYRYALERTFCKLKLLSDSKEITYHFLSRIPILGQCDYFFTVEDINQDLAAFLKNQSISKIQKEEATKLAEIEKRAQCDCFSLSRFNEAHYKRLKIWRDEALNFKLDMIASSEGMGIVKYGNAWVSNVGRWVELYLGQSADLLFLKPKTVKSKYFPNKIRCKLKLNHL